MYAKGPRAPLTPDCVMVSAALNEYLSEHGNGETFDDILAKPPINEPAPFDGSHPLTDYFISSSHNTYLLANQLWGSASPQAYTSALHGLAARAPARCVEMDVWWTSKKGPIITHGHTLTGSVPFQDACLAVGNAVGPNDLPTWISLECHVDADKQLQLVKIMQEAWGDKLLSTKLDGIDGAKVSPNDLRGRIVMMVEWYPPPGNSAEAISKVTRDDSSSSSESDDDNDDVKEMQQYRQSHKGVRPKIHEGLAKLGIYANSFKPQEGWLDKELADPLHALVNISESALLTLLKQAGMEGRLVEHGRHHLRRCYPKGLRVDSENLNPIQYWKCGTHVVGLNMQAWDTGTHINGALFRDTDGYVLKPESLRGGKKRTGKSQLKLTIVGGDDIPHAKEGQSRSLYVVAKVFRGTQKLEWKTKPVKNDDADPMFLSTVEWNWDDDDLVFLRVELKEDVWGRDNEVASYTLLVDRLASGLRFWPLFDKSGMPSVGRLLVDVDYKVTE